ncbi:MAG: hypothetical protein U5K00_24505 [Melioribacteraceae bacterium]|nr:hypothetical protein [Melioribacteraceae bacterium]
MFSKDKFYRNLNKYRKAIQIFSLLFLIAIPVLILLDIRYIVGNLYSISFWDFDIVDPSMVIQTIVLSKEFYLPLIDCCYYTSSVSAWFSAEYSVVGCVLTTLY